MSGKASIGLEHVPKVDHINVIVKINCKMRWEFGGLKFCQMLPDHV